MMILTYVPAARFGEGRAAGCRQLRGIGATITTIAVGEEVYERQGNNWAVAGVWNPPRGHASHGSGRAK